MQRITQRDLEGLCKTINKVTSSPEATYTETAEGKYIPNVGNYHLDYAYGGVKLVRMSNESGGISDISSGYGTKRELYNWMHAYLDGILLEA